MQENHPWEAVLNNVLGTRNLVDLALETDVERFVLVSTDKAVRPTNVMGATKRVAELFVESMNGRQDTRFVAVRFGNVFSSSGSAIPIFQYQIAQGGPVTVTHPDVIRYFMSIPEAAQLILQAGAMGEGGEIFILDMGEPIRIVDMARDLIRLHGLEPEKDIAIEFTGLRPGEKLYEELITSGEGIVPTGHEKIMVLRGKTRNEVALLAQIESLLAIARQGDRAAIRKKLREIVPEYNPAD
jgi:FlaA1/EpsC-like NDP-sugar epimerase